MMNVPELQRWLHAGATAGLDTVTSAAGTSDDPLCPQKSPAAGPDGRINAVIATVLSGLHKDLAPETGFPVQRRADRGCC
jgi:hypothetical protein